MIEVGIVVTDSFSCGLSLREAATRSQLEITTESETVLYHCMRLKDRSRRSIKVIRKLAKTYLAKQSEAQQILYELLEEPYIALPVHFPTQYCSLSQKIPT